LSSKSARQETRTSKEIFAHVSGLVYSGRSHECLSKLEGAKPPIRIIPTGVDSERLEDKGVKLHEVSITEANNIVTFLNKIECMDEMVMILIGEKGKKLVMPKDSSRYFEKGRQKIRKKIHRKMERSKLSGRMITLTYDPIRTTREEAWRNCGLHMSSFIDRIKVYYKRKKNIKKIQYFWVVEEQSGTGYPHFHLFIQDKSKNGMQGYIPAKYLKRQWGKGGTHIKKCSASIRFYITKYISKLQGMSVNALAHMWSNKRRLYGFSRVFVAISDKYEGSGWQLLGMFHPVKGFGIADKSGFMWCGDVDVGWILEDSVDQEEGYQVLSNRLYDGRKFLCQF